MAIYFLPRLSSRYSEETESRTHVFTSFNGYCAQFVPARARRLTSGQNFLRLTCNGMCILRKKWLCCKKKMPRLDFKYLNCNFCAKQALPTGVFHQNRV
jgi:hypothetical protein